MTRVAGLTVAGADAEAEDRLSPEAECSQPYLIPALSRRQDLVLRLLTVGWVAASAWFWLWWTAPARGEWNVGRSLATIGLAWLSLMAVYFLFFACRMTRPNPRCAVPRLRVAIVVTKAPAEPWAVVQQTLRAMLDQDFPHPYDVWLADEHPSGRTLSWCRGHGVKVSSRHGVPEYHQPVWPRRTKSKEGNLAYFYDTIGYAQYDVVAQLDADHVPARGYLTAMVRPFADSRIGYVAAPSICDANADKGWTVRGRLYKEAALHGPVQAGSNGGWAPLCIGSHYAVRTQALREAGGLGPELAEDYTTTLWIQSAGWDGVFALDAEAHGDGPETFDDMLVQEVQWARSLGAVMVRWAPGRLFRCGWRAGPRMGFALLYYFVQGVLSVVAAFLPVYAVLTGVSWGSTSIAGFYVHVLPASFLLTAIMLWLRRCGLLRPRDANVWSYEVVLFQMVRWPWTTWGFFQGMWSGWRATPKPFRVTPKGSDRARPLTAEFLVPLLLIAQVPSIVVGLIPPSGTVLGLYLILMLQGLVYCVVAVSVVFLHIWNNRVLEPRHRTGLRPGRRRPGKHAGNKTFALTADNGGRALVLTMSVVTLSASLLVWRTMTFVIV